MMIFKSLIGLPLILLFVQLQLGSSFEHVIYIDGDSGKDTSSCLTANDPGTPCQNLSWAFRAQNNSTKYVLSQGIHFFNTSIAFHSVKAVTIVGNGSTYNDTIVQCVSGNAGIGFFSSTNIQIRTLSFSGCSQHRSKFNFLPSLLISDVALLFHECIDVHIVSTSVDRSPNATGVLLIDTKGSITVSNSVFDQNGQSGLRITHNLPNSESGRAGTSFTIKKCIFSNNWAGPMPIAESVNRTLSSHAKQKQHANGGGGMAVTMKGNTTDVTITITICTFTHNFAKQGGGLFVLFQDSTRNNILNLKSTTFNKNNCPSAGSHKTRGGAMQIYSLISHGNVLSDYVPNFIHVDNCSLSENSAFSGGALSLILSPQKQHLDTVKVLIENTWFLNNTAQVGAAVDISPASSTERKLFAPINISSSSFIANRIVPHDMTQSVTLYQLGVGAIYTNKVPIVFRDNVHFEVNKGSALAVVRAQVDFSNCTAVFYGNHGESGGAIALLGAAVIIIDNGTKMTFTNNHASAYGGAISNIYVERESLMTSSNCFIQHKDPSRHPDDWGAIFSFFNNSASLSGHSIHSTSILPCLELGSTNTSKVLCWKNWAYYQNGMRVQCRDEIRTDTGTIAYRGNTSMSVSKVIPGEMFQLELDIFDDLGNNLSNQTIFSAYTSNDNVASVDPRYAFVSDQQLIINGIEDNNFTLLLTTTGERSWHVEMNMEIVECPPGFELSVENSTADSLPHCECAGIDDNFKGIVKCDGTLVESFLLNGFWMGKVSPSENKSTELVVSLCLPGFCNKDKITHQKIPRELDTLDDVLCGGDIHRTGILCGLCEENYGPAVNSPTFQCLLCNSTNTAANTVYYILTIYLPLLILFTGIVIFNIKLTTGPANAFIFYCQIVASNFNLKADGHIPLKFITPHFETLLKAYEAPYGIFNLDFLESFVDPLCLGTNLNVLDVLQLDYLVALCPLMMIIVVVIFVKLKNCCGCHISSKRSCCTSKSFFGRLKYGESLIHAFSAFVLLSYTKFSLTSSYIINIHPLFNASGDQIGQRRAYFAGHYEITDTEYIFRYFLPACFVLTLITIPPLFLFGYPVIWFEKCIIKSPRLWRLYPADKVQILLDTFQGCYRDKMRFFAGMYLFFRFVINIIYILTDDWFQQFIVQQIVCILFVVIIALCWPYKEEKWIFNYVDLLIFTNLAILNALSLYLFIYSKLYPGQALPPVAFGIQYVLVFLPLIYMVVYIVWSLMKNSCKEMLKKQIAKLKNTARDSEGNLLAEHNKNTDSDKPARKFPGFNRKADTPKPKQSTTYTEVSVFDESAEYNDIHDDLDTIFVRARAPNTYKPPPRTPSNTHTQRKTTTFTDKGSSSGTGFVSKDSGIHTRDCTDSLLSSQMTTLVSDASTHQNDYGST